MENQVSMEAEVSDWDHGVRIRRVKPDLSTKLRVEMAGQQLDAQLWVSAEDDQH